MNPTEDALTKATAGLDDNLQPTDPKQNKEPEPEAPKPAEPESPPENPAESKEPKEFSADELGSDEKPSEEPAKPSEIDTNGLPPETKYILDNLPAITARIKVGDKVQEIQVKTWTQLPRDVEFASKYDEMAFVNALQAQENRATVLQAKYQQDQQQTQTKEFEDRENTMIRDDLTELQKEGEIPKFKVKLDDPEFDKDPATQEVQKVMDYMEERNQQYLAEYNQGRPFRHIGFREAFYMYQRNNPNKPIAQNQEDQERRELAERLTGNRGLASKELRKPTIQRGTRIEDILNRIDAEW